eukprot:COSAG04_NODE_26579_length_293_cov_0.793814_1_plen_48_part_10
MQTRRPNAAPTAHSHPPKMEAADDEESHGKLVPVSEESEFQFHLFFSN